MQDLLLELDNTVELTPDVINNFRQSLLSDIVWEPFVGVKLFVLNMFSEHLANT